MGGKAGARGYLLQAFICILDSLSDGHDWLSYTAEPDELSEKVDIIWKYADSTKVVQVKSSQNQIDLPSVQSWATELRQSVEADRYELRLLGPATQSVIDLQRYDGVFITDIETINLDALVERAAQKLDKYLLSVNSVKQLGPHVREQFVLTLTSYALGNSIYGTQVTRADFDKTLTKWIENLVADFSRTSYVTVDKGKVRQIISPPRVFLGREEELTSLEDVIKKGARLIGIRGMAGIGKSALAAKLLSNVISQFPDWHIQVDLQGHTSDPVDYVVAMKLIIQSLEPNRILPSDPQGIESLYRSALHGTKGIVFVENVWKGDDVIALDPRSDHLFLFTSRNRFFVPGLVHADLLPLKDNPAIKLLQQISSRIEQNAAATLTELCGNLPLALRACLKIRLKTFV